jgi:hypothetical protein
MIVKINDENVLVSDISKKQLDDTTVWTIDGLECSRDEMIDGSEEIGFINYIVLPNNKIIEINKSYSI